MGTVFRYHEDSRTAERWSIAAKYRRLREAALVPALETAVVNDTAPSEYCYQAPEQDPA